MPVGGDLCDCDPFANKLDRVICYAKLFNSFLAQFNMEGRAVPHSPWLLLNKLRCVDIDTCSSLH